MSGNLYFDDLRVGQRFTSAKHTVTEAEIVDFASQFDPQPFHLDADAARETFFGRLVASGWHTAAITMSLLVGSGTIAGGVIGMNVEIRWPRPTLPGDTLQVLSEVIEVTPSRSRSDRGTALLSSETVNQNGEAVQILTSRLMVPRRTA